MSVDSSTSKLQARDGLSGDGSVSGYDSDSACLGGDMQLPNLFRNQTTCSAANKLRGSQDRITLLVRDAAGHSADPAADVEKGSTDASGEDEVFGIAQSEGLATHVRKVLQRQISVHSGGTLMRHLLDYFLVLLKIAAMGKSNRQRKCKRSASFDSRKLVLFFSILSSVGTLILIYLMLRVSWQAAEASVPV